MLTQLDVVLLFDTEDIFSPPEVGNDDSIKDLASILTEEGLRATFLFTGARALHLRERARPDVMAALALHEVGLHTRSPRHPCSPEYVQGKSWDEGVAEALRHEREGVAIIQEVFGQPACALSTHYEYATPHSQRAAALLQLPYVYAFPAAPPHYSVSWYAGALGLPWSSPTLDRRPLLSYLDGFDDHYPDDAAFEIKLQKLNQQIDTALVAGQCFMSMLLYHPQRVRLAEFIDSFWSPNGINYPRERWGDYGLPERYTPAQVATALRNFRHLARSIRHDQRLRPLSVADVARRYGSQLAEITYDDLHSAGKEICATGEILLHDRFSPAEILVALARSITGFAVDGQLPRSAPRSDVLGPKTNPIWFPEAQVYRWDMLVQRAQELLDHVTASGHLPAMLGAAGERVGVNHLYRALAEAYLDLCSGSIPSELRLRPMPRYPRLAEAIGLRYLRVAEAGLMDPDLDVDALYRHGKLQTWTLKPAVLA